MPFGKHKGEPIGELPLDYLRWLLDTCDLGGELRRHVFLSHKRRAASGTKRRVLA
ncbi:MAG: DUF3820 family protein [Phycisphaerales bacterium]|nr:DUF3820 family protein [Phycisphaerales bacterium]